MRSHKKIQKEEQPSRTSLIQIGPGSRYIRSATRSLYTSETSLVALRKPPKEASQRSLHNPPQAQKGAKPHWVPLVQQPQDRWITCSIRSFYSVWSNGWLHRCRYSSRESQHIGMEWRVLALWFWFWINAASWATNPGTVNKNSSVCDMVFLLRWAIKWHLGMPHTILTHPHSRIDKDNLSI